MNNKLYDREVSEELGQALRKQRMRTSRAKRGVSKALAKTLAGIHKRFGTDSLSPIKLMAERHDVQCVSTGFQALDDAISGTTVKKDGKRSWVPGSGRGLPRGRIIEVFGPEGSGKTTLGLELIAHFQELGFTCAYFDLENAADLDYADRIGCDTESWLFSQGGETGEQTFDMLIDLAKGDVVDLVLVDSVAQLVPQSELDSDMDGGQPGAHARLMNKGLRKLSHVLKRGHKTMFVFLNQTRSKIGGYGNPETTTGGNALKFYASVRLRVVNAGEIKAGGEKGIRSKVKVRKTRLAVPFAECWFDITGGNGITACYSSNSRSGGNPLKDEDDEDE